MVRYSADDVKTSGGGIPAEGRYLAEIMADGTEEKRSGKGDPMFSVAFKDVLTGNLLCYDAIMMAGRGLGIGHKKLIQLGVVDPDAKDWNVETIDLIGKRAVLTLKHQSYKNDKGEDKKSAKPSFDAEGFGYMPASTWTTNGAPHPGGIGNDENCPF